MKILRMSRYRTRKVSISGWWKTNPNMWGGAYLKPFRRPLFGYRRK